MVVQAKIEIAAVPAVVFAIYRDVARWNTWDPDTKASSLEGPFAVGSKGRITPAKGHAVPMTIVELTEGRSFAVECRVPLFRMLFEHNLSTGAAGTTVIHRATFSGPLNFILGRVLGGQLREGLPKTLQSLKRLAESRSPQATASRAA